MRLRNALILVVGLMSAHSLAAPTVFSLRSDGTILKSGEPWFPMGFYIDRNTAGSYQAQINTIANAGAFNVINLPMSTSGDWTPVLDLCVARNISMVLQLSYDGSFLGLVNSYKDNSAIYAWSVADDADNGTFNFSQLQYRHDQIKAADANHLTETSLTGYYASRRADADRYTAIPDVSGYQCYPIAPYADYDLSPTGNPLTEAYLRTRMYVESAGKAHRPMIMNNQVFSWGMYGSPPVSRWPTAAEERNMVYSGLAAGIKGIISYSMSDQLVSQTALWNECSALCADVTTLKGALLNGTLIRVNTGDQELVESYWTHGGACYVVVVNTSYTSAKSVSLTLPGSYTGAVSALFPRMASTLTRSGSTLAGSVAAQEVEVYRVAESQTAVWMRLQSAAAAPAEHVAAFDLRGRLVAGGEQGAQALIVRSSRTHTPSARVVVGMSHR